MDTHVHVVVQTPEPNLGRGMQWLCGRYAQDFNARWQRSGHLFGRRFYSAVITTDRHLLGSIAYVLRNPVEAGLVDRAESWPWSSYASTVGLVAAPSFLDVAGTLSHLGRRPDAARRALTDAVMRSASTDDSI